jgi:hypothetical protein
MSSINGIGTTLYGKKGEDLDGSYVATEWFIFAFLPIIPIGSFRVWKEKITTSGVPLIAHNSKIEYRRKKVPLDWEQVMRTYLKTWGVIAALLLVSFFISNFIG